MPLRLDPLLFMRPTCVHGWGPVQIIDTGLTQIFLYWALRRRCPCQGAPQTQRYQPLSSEWAVFMQSTPPLFAQDWSYHHTSTRGACLIETATCKPGAIAPTHALAMLMLHTDRAVHDCTFVRAARIDHSILGHLHLATGGVSARMLPVSRHQLVAACQLQHLHRLNSRNYALLS